MWSKLWRGSLKDGDSDFFNPEPTTGVESWNINTAQLWSITVEAFFVLFYFMFFLTCFSPGRQVGDETGITAFHAIFAELDGDISQCDRSPHKVVYNTSLHSHYAFKKHSILRKYCKNYYFCCLLLLNQKKKMQIDFFTTMVDALLQELS